MFKRNVILQGVVGSTAYGLAREGSDVDQLGIYVAPFRDVLGLNGPKVVDDSVVQHEPDLTLHEVGKYCRLALQCNPTVIELLYLPSYTTETFHGRYLVQFRDKFLSEHAVKGRYGGYAKAQAERLMRRNEEGKEGFSSDVGARTAKHGRHCMRLLLQGAQLLRTGEIQVNVSEHRDELFAAGELAEKDPQAFYDQAIRKLKEFDNIDSVLPLVPDRKAVNEVLIAIRVS